MVNIPLNMGSPMWESLDAIYCRINVESTLIHTKRSALLTLLARSTTLIRLLVRPLIRSQAHRKNRTMMLSMIFTLTLFSFPALRTLPKPWVFTPVHYGCSYSWKSARFYCWRQKAWGNDDWCWGKFKGHYKRCHINEECKSEDHEC